MKTIRQVRELIQPQMVMEGAGVLLRRSIAPQISNRFDPFLLFDHFALNDPADDPIPGFPMHPHRGIETVTYINKGRVDHKDSLGNAGTIGPGDVQWMTSGSGILHEEMPFRDQSGVIDGFQLWVNLPAALKMKPPRYQEFKSTSIPEAEGKGYRVRVVAGSFDMVNGPVSEIAAQPVYLEVALEPGTEFHKLIPKGHTVLAYIYEGEGVFGEDRQCESVILAVFGDGEEFRVQAGRKLLRFMLMAGAPSKEPIYPYGPFVMNTRQEIEQALLDLQNGTFVRNGVE